MSNHEDESEFFTEEDFDVVVRQNQKRRIYRRKPKKALDLVSHIVAKRGIAAQQSSRRLQDLWDTAVGVDVANHTVVGSIRRGQLEVTVANSSLLQSLSLQKQPILKKIQMQIPEIKNLRFRIGRIN